MDKKREEGKRPATTTTATAQKRLAEHDLEGGQRHDMEVKRESEHQELPREEPDVTASKATSTPGIARRVVERSGTGRKERLEDINIPMDLVGVDVHSACHPLLGMECKVSPLLQPSKCAPSMRNFLSCSWILDYLPHARLRFGSALALTSLPLMRQLTLAEDIVHRVCDGPWIETLDGSEGDAGQGRSLAAP